MSTALVNYSRQINDAHQACLAAKELGGKKAHECGTWLLKQKESLPHGAWLPWVKQHCQFTDRTARFYLSIAALNRQRVSDLSMRDALWEVAQEKAEEAEIEEEIAAGKGKPSRGGTRGDALFETIRKHQAFKDSPERLELAALYLRLHGK